MSFTRYGLAMPEGKKVAEMTIEQRHEGTERVWPLAP